jgi:hypothetical protein
VRYYKRKLRDSYSDADVKHEQDATHRVRDFAEMEEVSKMPPAPKNLVERPIIVKKDKE